MKINFILPLLSTLVLISACSSATKKCPKTIAASKDERALEEEQAPEFKIGTHDDQATINMNSYDETQYWKGNMNKRLEKIKQIYDAADWTDAAHKERFFKNLAASQKAFETYLKAQVELQYPKEEEDEWWGSGIAPCINMVYTDHYKQRYLDLELWEKGTPKGETCGGSALTEYAIKSFK